MMATEYSFLFEDVGFYYQKNNWVLRHLSFALPKNGFLAIVGKSGSGKSTFLSMLRFSLHPKEGKIKYGFSTPPAPVFQSALLLDYLTVKENILFGIELNRTKGDEFQKWISILDLEQLLTKIPPQLSGGEKIRVSIARALLMSSPVILLDEPTGQLDEKNSLKIYECLKEISQEKLIIMVTHDDQYALNFASQIYEIKDSCLINTIKTGSITQMQSSDSLQKRKPIAFSNAFKIIFKFIKSRWTRVSLSSWLLGLSLAILGLGLNISFNCRESLSNVLKDYYSYGTVSIAEKEVISHNGNLTLERYSSPSEENLKELSIPNVLPSLDFFLPKYNEIFLNKKYSTICFLPVLEQNPNSLLYGNPLKTHFDLIVNQSLLSEFKITAQEAIGRKVSFHHSVFLYTSKTSQTDLIPLTYNFTISGVSKELSAFNEPIAYYDYHSLYDYLDNFYPQKINEETQVNQSISSMLIDNEYYNEDFTSRKILAFINDPINFTKANKDLFFDGIIITSKALEVVESTEKIVSSLIKLIMAFIVLSLISAFMLEFISVYSLYDENIRLFSLIQAFSKSQKNKLIFAFSQSLIFLVSTIIATLILSLITTSVLKIVFSYLSLPYLFKTFSPKAFLIILMISILITVPASVLPLRQIKNEQINRQLEGQD